MSVFNRMTDIVNSNINGILDEAENPAKMVRLLTREMEETLCNARSASARYIADRKQVLKQAAYHRTQCALWCEKAELAVAKGRDDLARGALTEKSNHERQACLLDDELSQIDESLARLQSDTDQLSEKLKAAHARQKALVLRGDTARSRIRVKRQLHSRGHEEALARFEAYERRLDDLEGQAQAYDLGHKPEPGLTLASEIDALAHEQAVSDELAALKNRIQNTEERSRNE